MIISTATVGCCKTTRGCLLVAMIGCRQYGLYGGPDARHPSLFPCETVELNRQLSLVCATTPGCGREEPGWAVRAARAARERSEARRSDCHRGPTAGAQVRWTSGDWSVLRALKESGSPLLLSCPKRRILSGVFGLVTASSIGTLGFVQTDQWGAKLSQDGVRCPPSTKKRNGKRLRSE